MPSPTEIIATLLESPTDAETVRALVAEDVTYVSLNHSDPDLHRIMPWAGSGQGADRIVQTFVDVGRYWEVLSFEMEALFGSGENVAGFGRFTYRSRVLGKTVTSPFAIFAKVVEGRCTYLQFMEDTFATAASFRSGGSWTFQSDPDGEIVTI